MSLLRDLNSGQRAPRWRHWIVAVEQIGRISLPPPAWQALGPEPGAEVRSGDLALVLRPDVVGAHFRIDGRGRLFLPAWLRAATGLSGSVLVAARTDGLPMVAVAATGILEDLMDRVTGER